MIVSNGIRNDWSGRRTGITSGSGERSPHVYYPSINPLTKSPNIPPHTKDVIRKGITPCTHSGIPRLRMTNMFGLRLFGIIGEVLWGAVVRCAFEEGRGRVIFGVGLVATGGRRVDD